MEAPRTEIERCLSTVFASIVTAWFLEAAGLASISTRLLAGWLLRAPHATGFLATSHGAEVEVDKYHKSRLG